MAEKPKLLDACREALRIPADCTDFDAEIEDLIEAARAVGSGSGRIIIKHIIPNSLSPLIVQATLGVASAILTAAGLSFIGLGIQPPVPEWGAMLSSGRTFIRDYPYMTMFPGLAIMITILALNFLGDGLRDALDPKLKR